MTNEKLREAFHKTTTPIEKQDDSAVHLSDGLEGLVNRWHDLASLAFESAQAHCRCPEIANGYKAQGETWQKCALELMGQLLKKAD